VQNSTCRNVKPLTILTTFNEIDYMPLKKRWCDANGLDLYVLDNYSDDGTWEWLQENGVNSERVDTSGAFDLISLQKATMKAIHRLKPPWIVYIGADTFYVGDEKLCDHIERVDKKGFNVINFRWNNFYNTGEEMKTFDPVNTYFYYSSFRNVDFIFKYHPLVTLTADDISGKVFKKYFSDIEGFNYGNTKPAEVRMEISRRRQKAWEEGMNRDWGSHYREGDRKNWIWDKELFKDIREGDLWKHIIKLKHDTAR